MSRGDAAPVGLATLERRPDFRPRSAFGVGGLVAVLLLHVLLAWALLSGLAQQAVQIVKKPLMATLVPEAAPPPPPPPPPPPKRIVAQRELPVQPPAYVPPPEVSPPPQAEPAPTITAVQSAEPVAPPPPAAPPPPEAPPMPRTVQAEVGVACPGYQEMLRQALSGLYDRVGIAGTVRVQFRVRGQQVVEVTPLSGPPQYFRAVQAGVRRFDCRAAGGEEVVVAFSVAFREQ